MKKLILLISALLILSGCTGENKIDIISANPRIVGVEYDGHNYILAYSCEGVCIIHSESCPCNKTNKK